MSFHENTCCGSRCADVVFPLRHPAGRRLASVARSQSRRRLARVRHHREVRSTSDQDSLAHPYFQRVQRADGRRGARVCERLRERTGTSRTDSLYGLEDGQDHMDSRLSVRLWIRRFSRRASGVRYDRRRSCLFAGYCGPFPLLRWRDWQGAVEEGSCRRIQDPPVNVGNRPRTTCGR